MYKLIDYFTNETVRDENGIITGQYSTKELAHKEAMRILKEKLRDKSIHNNLIVIEEV